MILRNPALRRDSFLTGFYRWLSVLIFIPTGFLHAQGIIGHVAESFSRQSIPGATIKMWVLDSLVAQTTADSSGYYSIQTSLAGRVSIHIHHIDYEEYAEHDIIIDGYSTKRLENLLTRKAYDLPGVTLSASADKSTDFVQSIEPEDLVIVAGNFDDPVRVAHSLPGMVLLNDQANHISARGQSPIFNNWYLEGLEIVNPNHTSNAGTFSDLPTQYGGGVNMFSAQILGSTDIYTGVGPLNIDHAAGATINMELHETAKPEWRAKAGLIGFELGGGSRVGRNGILDINLRYSFTGLLTDLGADFGGEKIGFYDGVASYTHQANHHKLKVFAWAGSSHNDFDQVQPPEDREEYKDFFDIHYENDILGAGGRYDVSLSEKTFFRSGIAYSTDHSTYTKYDDEISFPENINLDDQVDIVSSFVELSTQHATSFHSTFGIHYLNRSYVNDDISGNSFFEESLGKFFIQSHFDVSPSFQIEVAGEIERSFKYDQFNAGYRGKLIKHFGASHSVFAGIRQSAGEPIVINGGTANNYFMSRNMEAGWKYAGDVHAFGLNAYFQHMYNLPVLFASDARYYLTDSPIVPVGFSITNITTDGEANQYGVEGVWSMVSKSGWRAELNQSVYKSIRGVEGEKQTGGRYDGRFATHVLISKEIIQEKKGKNRIWNFSCRGIINGGLWEPAIDTFTSDIFNTTLAVYPGLYHVQLPTFKRIDASISRTISTAKIRWQYKLDIQNLLGMTNIAYHYYDPYLADIIAQEHLGIIPVLSVQASW